MPPPPTTSTTGRPPPSRSKWPTLGRCVLFSVYGAYKAVHYTEHRLGCAIQYRIPFQCSLTSMSFVVAGYSPHVLSVSPVHHFAWLSRGVRVATYYVGLRGVAAHTDRRLVDHCFLGPRHKGHWEHLKWGLVHSQPGEDGLARPVDAPRVCVKTKNVLYTTILRRMRIISARCRISPGHSLSVQFTLCTTPQLEIR